MLAPKRVRHRRVQKGRMKGVAYRGSEVSFGDFGLQATSCGFITSRQIEAARIAMTRYVKRGGKVWIRIFPHKSYTKKPLEVRMGKGKAAVEGWVAVVRPANMLFEISGVGESLAKEALSLAAAKLPIKTRMIKR